MFSTMVLDLFNLLCEEGDFHFVHLGFPKCNIVLETMIFEVSEDIVVTPD